MKARTIPAIVMLIGGFASCIITMLNEYSLLESLKIILLSLLVFYIFGLIVRMLLNKLVNVDPDPKDVEMAVTIETDEEKTKTNSNI